VADVSIAFSFSFQSTHLFHSGCILPMIKLHKAHLVVLRTHELNTNISITDTTRQIFEELGMKMSIVVFWVVTLCDDVGG
jgi:hypothetical protein